jgi:hypothetical protein
MIYFHIQPEQIVIKRFKKGQEIYSATEPALAAVVSKRNEWRAIAAGRAAKEAVSSHGSPVYLCNPFRTRDLVLEDADIAAQCLRLLYFGPVINPFTTILRPEIAIHPRIEPERPLLAVEKRNFKEIAMRAGARAAYLCELPTMLTARMLEQSRRVPAQIGSDEGPRSRIE